MRKKFKKLFGEYLYIAFGCFVLALGIKMYVSSKIMDAREVLGEGFKTIKEY